MPLIIGTAGWSIPRQNALHFPSEGSSLERYAQRFNCVEINSSFHRPHRRSTWQRWAASVPQTFRFAAKLPKTITHERKLVDSRGLVEAFLDDAGGLGEKLAILLVQLPPKLAFDPAVAEAFFNMLASRTKASIVCEPRHSSWFDEDAGMLLDALLVARAAADPARVPQAALPGGWRGISYFRLHGSPHIYRSSYDDGRLDDYAAALKRELVGDRGVWCMFDNTASSAAAGDAIALSARLGC